MPKVSINILTKNRALLLGKALTSVMNQSFKGYEIIVVNDGSTDNTVEVLKDLKFKDLKIINHHESQGITFSRQEALKASSGEYIAILDDDDEWIDADKLQKQVEYLNDHPDTVLVGGGIVISSAQISNTKISNLKLRPETDEQIRSTMLFRNNFFTSSVVFRRQAALDVGGFIKDDIDLAEDYDLWLRIGKLGKFYNFPEAFVNYRQPSYNKNKFKQFLRKQLRLISKHKSDYPYNSLAQIILKLRLIISSIF